VIRPGGTKVTATVTNSNATAAQLVTRDSTKQAISVDIDVGQSRSPTSIPLGGVSFDPVGSGTTTVAATIPGFTALPTASGTVTVSAPALTVNTTTRIGSGLQTVASVSLGANNYGTVTIHVSSSNPAVALIAPTATTPGVTAFDTTLTQPTTSFNFYMQGVEGITGNSTATSTITATAPAFTTGSGTATVVAPAVELLSLPASTTSLSPNSFFQVLIGAVNVNNTGLSGEQVIRPGGTKVTATVTNSNATAAQLVTKDSTRQTVSVDIPVGQSRSPSSIPLGGVSFDPLASGTTTVAATIPGFTAIPGATGTVTVNAPALTMGTNLRVGSGLQTVASVSLGANDYGTTTIHISSSNPAVALVAPTATTPGTTAFDTTLTAPTTSFNYYVQGVEGATGSVTITATAPGFTDGSATAAVVAPAIEFLSLPTTTTAGAANIAFQVLIGAININNNGLSGEQAIRPGGNAATVTISNSNSATAQLVAGTTGQLVTVNIDVGQSRSPSTVNTGGVAFDPLAAGTTTVSVAAPGFTTLPGGSELVTVNP
jgi:hypothetical protein